MFFDNENIPLVVRHDEYCDNHYNDCNTPNTSKVDETKFTTSSSTDKPSTLQLR